MNRYSALFETPDVAVGRFDHPRLHLHSDPAEECANEHSINLVERGSFSIQIGRRTWELGPGDLFLTYPGLTYRCRHREAIPTDSCLTVACLQSDSDCDLTTFSRIASARAVTPATNRIAYLFRRISLGAPAAENRMAVEAATAALFAEIGDIRDGRKRTFRRHQLAWYAERVDAVLCQLETHYAAPQSLGSLARSVGMSPFHFARVFGELAGIPPHRYLLRVRMQEAARRLQQGATVTDACFSSGFHNMSHFIRSFQRWFGVSPAQYARQRVSSNLRLGELRIISLRS